MRKYFSVLFLTGVAMVSCKKESRTPESTNNIDHYEVFGDSISGKQILSSTEMFDFYKKMKTGDTISVAFESVIQEVCQRKGCWMKVGLNDSISSFVRFTDYSFFVPMNAANQKVVMEGKAFVDVVSVEELRHFADDAGKSAKEIAKITEPKITFAFKADGVAIEK